MNELVAPVTNITFSLEEALMAQMGALPVPFPGMDKSGAAVCDFYVKASCMKSTNCPFRHVRGDKTIVCKHWLRGLCKKGDGCEFLHEYDMSKMPECYFYSRFNACHNKECPFLHIDPESKIRDCPWYDRGFCRHGPSCRHRHVRRVLCLNFLAGFCPKGPDCADTHPKFELPPIGGPDDPRGSGKKIVITCHYCGEPGHKVSHCAKVPPEVREQHAQMSEYGYGHHGFRPYGNPMHGARGGGPGGDRGEHRGDRGEGRGRLKNLDEIVCFKCGENGHFANRCTKGHLAFLSANAGRRHHDQPQQHQNNERNG